jgi:hypothetical protein
MALLTADVVFTDHMDGLRRQAVSLVSGVLPFYRGQGAYWEVCKDYSAGFGTTCGCLVHWMLWKLGCTDTNLVNRSAPGLNYVVGASITKLHSYTNLRDPIGPFDPGPGDILIIDDATQEEKFKGTNKQYLHTHTFVILDATRDGPNITMSTGEAGNAPPDAPNGTLEAHAGQRVATVGGGHSRVTISNSLGWSTFVLAWLPLSKVPFGAL